MGNVRTFLKGHETLAKLLAGAGSALGWDYVQHDNWTDWDKFRVGNFLLNGAIGFIAGDTGLQRRKGSVSEALRVAMLAPTKDFIINAQGTPGKLNAALDNFSQQTAAIKEEMKNTAKDSRSSRNIALGLGLGALGLGGLAVYKYLAQKKERPSATVKYRLKGKTDDPWSEAVLDMPIRTPRLSPKAKEGLESGIRRQVSKNIKYMTLKRDPNTGKMIPYEEWQRLYGEDMDASTKNPNEAYTSRLDAKYDNPTNSHDNNTNSYDNYADLPGAYKTASARAWTEGVGALAHLAAGVAGGAYLGDKYIKSDKVPGALIGAAVGATPTVFGQLLGLLAGTRTISQQLKHDNSGSGAEFILPGYAAFQSARRNHAVNTPTASIEEEGRVNYEDEDYEDDDFDKESAMAPQPLPPSPQPPLPPAPQPPPPAGEQNIAPVRNPSVPEAAGEAAKKLPDSPGVAQAMGAIDYLRKRYGIAPTPQEQAKRNQA